MGAACPAQVQISELESALLGVQPDALEAMLVQALSTTSGSFDIRWNRTWPAGRFEYSRVSSEPARAVYFYHRVAEPNPADSNPDKLPFIVCFVWHSTDQQQWLPTAESFRMLRTKFLQGVALPQRIVSALASWEEPASNTTRSAVDTCADASSAAKVEQWDELFGLAVMNHWTTAGVGPSAVDRWNRSLMAMMLVLPSNYYLSVQPASSSSPLLQHTHFAGYAPLPLTFLPWRTRANAFAGGPSVSLVQSQPQAAAGDGRLSAEATGRVGVEIMVRMAYPNSTVGMDGALKLTYDLTALASLLDPIFEPDTAGATFYVIDHRMAVLYSSNRSVYSSALSELNLAHIDPCLAVALRDKLGLHPPEPRQADGSGDPRYSCGGCDAVPDGADDSNFLAMVFDYYLRRWQRGGNESELSRPRSVPRLSPGLRAFALGLCTSPQLRSQLRWGLRTSWQHART
jgi:hypothetical protein